MQVYTKPRALPAQALRVGDEAAVFEHGEGHLVGADIDPAHYPYRWVRVIDVVVGADVEITLAGQVTHFTRTDVLIREVVEVEPWNIAEIEREQSRARHPGTTGKVPPTAQPFLPDGSPNPYQTRSVASGVRAGVAAYGHGAALAGR